MRVETVEIQNNSDVQTLSIPQDSVIVNIVKKLESGDNYTLHAVYICNEKKSNINYYAQIICDCSIIPQSSSYAGSFVDSLDLIKHLIYWN